MGKKQGWQRVVSKIWGFPMGEPLRRLCVPPWVLHFSAIRSVPLVFLLLLFFLRGQSESGETEVQFDSDYSGGDGASTFF